MLRKFKQPETQKKIKTKMMRVREAEKLVPAHTAAGNEKWHNYPETCLEISLRLNVYLLHESAIVFPHMDSR